MTAKPCIALLSAALAVTACQKSSEVSPVEQATSEPVTTEVTPPPPATTAATPLPDHSTSVSVTPEATPCGAEKLQNYLNLLPTSTAKDEIARTVGHDRVRYVPLEQEKAEAAPTSMRVTAGVGVDGRIKEFTCG
uniref:hypothetical protein n=1 Tax=Altererythrobacter segetis TaxID=1104773 RepID=UPI00140A706A|nr:hypothetical protein [Altererythrobacter segetis]